jgi:hypothetical protein
VSEVPYVPEERQAVYLTGDALAGLIETLREDMPAHSLRISQWGGNARWKVDEGTWSIPVPQDHDPSRTH